MAETDLKETGMTDEQLAAALGQHRSKAAFGKVLTGIGMAIFLIGIFTHFAVCVIGFIVAGVGTVISGKHSEALKRQLGDELVRGALEEVFGKVEYEPFRHISEETAQSAGMLFPFGFNVVNGSDRIKAVYHGLNIELSDVELVERTDYYDEETSEWKHTDKKVFSGQWLVCDFGKELSADLRLAESAKLNRRERANTITTDNEAFNRRFVVRSENEHEAFYILTPHMMEYILSMAKKSGGEVYMSFLRGGKLHVALASGRDLFELGSGKVNTALLRQKFAGEIRWFTGLLDELRLVDTLYRKD